MARIRDGLFGGFSGKLGNIVGVFRNGSYHLRTVPARVSNPKTPEQQANRTAFGMRSRLARQLKPFIETSLSCTEKASYRGAFISYNSGSAVQATEEGQMLIDYPNLIVSAGRLKGPEEPSAERTPEGNIRVRWNDNSGEGNARPDDRALLLALHEGYIAGYQLEGAARRAGQDVLELGKAARTRPVHVYLAMAAAGGKAFSDSVYLGLVG